MFDLEQAIRDWKLSWGPGESISEGSLRELETHLRESVTDLQQRGLTLSEAFGLACQRLGHPASLEVEFGKVHSGLTQRRRIFWMLSGYLGGVVLTSVVAGISTWVGLVTAWLGFSGTSAGIAFVVATGMLWALVLGTLYRFAKRRASDVARGNLSFGWLVGFLAFAVVARVLTFVGLVAHSRVVTLPELGESTLWSAWGGQVIGVGLIVGCVGIILATRDKVSGLEKA